ncbi:unnamed protein product [Protopolystoma xenopodis]|uniref:Uncharacterized protein n=1 Tax=Protopolystoma xenopodis TaxID=117903 RepID=A0A448WBP0_9PLAT|nr:unnamed protein product [Protopolystoma xenopodis]
MTPLTEDSGETFGNVPSQWSNAGNHKYYGRGHGTWLGRTPIMAAVVAGHPKVVHLLLTWGCAVHSVDAAGRSLLSQAVAASPTCSPSNSFSSHKSRDALEVVRELLARGLDEAHKDNSGSTPLHLATEAGRTDMVQYGFIIILKYDILFLLLQAGASPKVQDNSGSTVLLVACQNGYPLISLFLLAACASPLSPPSVFAKYNPPQDTSLLSPAVTTFKDEFFPFTKLPTTTANPESCAFSPVISSCTAGRQPNSPLKPNSYNVRKSSQLLNLCATPETRRLVNQADLEGRSPLMISALKKQEKLVQLLLAFGADPNSQIRSVF